MKQNIIYALTDPRTNKVRYVGLTKNGMERPKQHAKESRYENSHKAHWIQKLSRLGLKYGIKVLEVLESPEQLFEAERKWITHYRHLGNELTNMTDGGDGWANLTKEMRNKISRDMKGNKRGLGNKSRTGQTSPFKGKKHTPEAIAKMSAAQTGKILSQEARDKIGAASKGNHHGKGKKLSAEHRAILAKINKGNQHRKGKKLSEAHKQAVSKANKEKIVSEETRIKMSIASKKQWARRKAQKAQQQEEAAA